MMLCGLAPLGGACGDQELPIDPARDASPPLSEPEAGPDAGSPTDSNSGADVKPEIESAPAPTFESGTATCISVSQGLATGDAKVDAARCFGLTYSEVFDCTFSATDDVTSCVSSDMQYVVGWSDDVHLIPSPIDGRAYDRLGDYIAVIFEYDDGTYGVDWGTGELARCTTSVDNYCRYTP
jgi:hypothetical protein